MHLSYPETARKTGATVSLAALPLPISPQRTRPTESYLPKPTNAPPESACSLLTFLAATRR